MTRLPACLLAVVIAGFAWALPAQPVHAQEVQPLDRIVAVVDEDVILRSELDRAMANILGQYAGRMDQLPPRDVLERQVLERLILMELQVARADGAGISVDDQQLDSALAGIASQNNLSLEQMAAQLARDGMTLADLRASVRDEIMVQRLQLLGQDRRGGQRPGEAGDGDGEEAGGQSGHGIRSGKAFSSPSASSEGGTRYRSSR